MRRLAAVLALSATCVQADYREGLEHLSRGRFDEAYAELKASADAGDVNSARYLGWLLERGMTYHGTTFEPRIEESTQWYRKAAELGDRHSQDMLGVAYAGGRGVPQDSAAALGWFGRNRDVAKTLAGLAKYPQADREDLAAWILAVRVIIEREVSRAPRLDREGRVDLLFKAETQTVSIYKSEATSDLETLAMKYGRIAMESAPPTPAAVRNRFKYGMSVDFRFRP